MDLLILGGTRFLGLHLVEAALERGHRVTLFNRGLSRPDLFPDVERLAGSRDGDLSALRGRRWDAVIDTSGYLPREVRASAGLLADSAEHYTFVSSISVYEDFGRTGLDEEAPVLAPPDPEPEELDMELYGGLKVGCERAAEAAMLGEGPRGAPRHDRWSARLSAAVRDRPGHTRTGDGEAGRRNRCGHLAEAGARVASGVAGCHPVGVGLESAGTV